MTHTSTFVARMGPLPDAPKTERAQDVSAAIREQGAGAEIVPLLRHVASGSPFLSRLMLREAGFVAGMAAQDPDRLLDDLIAEVSALAQADDLTTLTTGLRSAKRRAALLIGLADIGGVWTTDAAYRALSRFADETIRTAVSWHLDARKLAECGGLIVLALGKLGAHELNYSSDVDLVLFFDDEKNPGTQSDFNKLARDLHKTLSQSDTDGYVFRVDLRLRPDPGSTPPCMAVSAAEAYYERAGLNWERAAFIKARAVAGDIAAGDALLERLKPFVWRRYLDFAAVEDVRSMKRLMHRHKGHGEIVVAGHDLKIGRGGIREIEFFVQTQQLIAGGRDPALRVRGTLEGLRALCMAGWIAEEERDSLTDDYLFLRRLEHRIQMTDDRQTHQMPSSAEALERLASFAGFGSLAAMEADLRAVLTRVAERFQGLFAEADPDADHIAAPDFSGFANPADAAATVSRWSADLMPATRNERARKKLAALAPRAVAALSAAREPDRALREFDRFLNGLPGGVQVFSLFLAKPELLDLLTELCAVAPALSKYLSRNSAVLDGVLAPDFFAPLSQRDAMAVDLQAALSAAEDFEGALDSVRRWSKERHFRVGVQLLHGAKVETCAASYADLADACLAALVPWVDAEIAVRHGAMPGGGAVILALGRLGGREMTAASDLDLMVIYDAPDGAMSDGAKPLAPPQYYARWTQKLVAAMTAPTAEGALYAVDMRLRPSGQAGPLATRLASFQRYQAQQAWTWEHMALLRARVVAGPPALSAEVDAALDEVLDRPRDGGAARQAALEMREKTAAAAPPTAMQPWAFKTARGGLLDLDFIAQIEALLTLGSRARTLSSAAIFEALHGADVVDAETADRLAEAHRIQSALLQLERVALSDRERVSDASEGLKAIAAQRVGVPSFGQVEALLQAAQEDALAAFRDRIGTA